MTLNLFSFAYALFCEFFRGVCFEAVSHGAQAILEFTG